MPLPVILQRAKAPIISWIQQLADWKKADPQHLDFSAVHYDAI